MNETSIKPYLIEAFYKWCIDNNLTPFIKVESSLNNKIPKEFEKELFYILNISPFAINNFIFDNLGLSFETSFNHIMYNVFISYDSILSIFTKENGNGLEFSQIEILNTKKTTQKKGSHLKLIK